MAKAKLIVFTSPADAQAEEVFNEWYNTVHVPQLLELPGFVAARRYKLSQAQLHGDVPPSGHHYVAEYDIDGDVQAALDVLKAAGPAGHFTRGGKDGQDDTSKSPRTVAFAVEVVAEDFPPAPPRSAVGTP
jgi:hypothetical protein